MKEGWKYKKLKENARVQNGFAFDSKLFNEEGAGMPLIRIRDIKRGFTYTYTTENCPEDFHIKDEDLLIGMDGDFNVCSWSGGKALLNQRVCHVIPNDKLLSKFLYYFLPFPLLKINKKTAYSTVKHLSSKTVNDIDVPFLPLSEQERIVERLDAAFAQIDELKNNAERQLAEARALFQSALTQAMQPKPGWQEKKLKEIGLTQTGTTPSKSDKSNYGDYIPFIRPSEIDFDGCGSINYDCEMKLSEKGLSIGRLFKKHSVLMVCIGATISKVGFSTQDISCNQQINVLYPSDKYHYKYIYYAMRNDDFKRKVIKEGTSAQATLPIINKSKWENLTLFVPDIDEQQHISNHLDSLSSHVRELEKISRKTAAECDAMKQALLRQIFE